MKVELSEQSRKRVEQLLEEGTYPSVEAVVEAALEQLEHPDFADVDFEELNRRASNARESGTARPIDEKYMRDLRSRAEAARDAVSGA